MKTNDPTVFAPAPGVRIELADVLRGIAILGIILLHSIEHFNFYRFPEAEGFLKFSDVAVWDGLFFFFAGKCYGLFALLFGFSFFVQDANHTGRGGDFRGRFAWRLFLLFLIGNLDAAFFTAEVLVMYALVGFVLIPVCRLKTKTLVVLGAICLLQPVEWIKIIVALSTGSTEAIVSPNAELWAATYSVQATGTFWETIKVNLWEGQLASLTWAWDNGRIFQTAGLFMFGMVVGRTGFLVKNDGASRRMIVTLIWGILIFFPLYGVANMLPKFVENQALRVPLLLIVNSLHKMAFMAFLIGAVGWLYFNTKRVGGALGKLQIYGRMSLTNYVTQSIVGSFLFYNWGLGLDLGATYSALIGVAIFAVQYAFGVWWLKRRRQGPLEWAWKKATWVNIGL